MLDHLARHTLLRGPARAASALALAVMLATPARALSPVNLRWDACLGDGGVSNKSFACDTNIGFNTLVGSWVAPMDLFDLVGNDIAVDFGAYMPVMPAWWEFKNAGACRQNSLSFSAVIPLTAANCVDWASGQATALVTSYTLGPIPGIARLLATTTIPPSLIEIFTGQEYFSFSIRINNLKTVGAGACGACDVPICIILKAIDLKRMPPAYEVPLRPANLADAFVLWQPAPGQTMCARSVPVQNRTWGEVKSLYR